MPGKRRLSMLSEPMKDGINAVIDTIDDVVYISGIYKDASLREYYNNKMAKIRDMLAELKNREAQNGV
jgi:hypothetical protein